MSSHLIRTYSGLANLTISNSAAEPGTAPPAEPSALEWRSNSTIRFFVGLTADSLSLNHVRRKQQSHRNFLLIWTCLSRRSPISLKAFTPNVTRWDRAIASYMQAQLPTREPENFGNEQCPLIGVATASRPSAWQIRRCRIKNDRPTGRYQYRPQAW